MLRTTGLWPAYTHLRVLLPTSLRHHFGTGQGIDGWNGRGVVTSASWRAPVTGQLSAR